MKYTKTKHICNAAMSLGLATILTGCEEKKPGGSGVNAINDTNKDGFYESSGGVWATARATSANFSHLKEIVEGDKLNTRIAEAAQMYAVSHPDFIDFVRQTEKVSVQQITDPATGKVIGVKFSEAQTPPTNAQNIMGELPGR